jgi:hypothetical protein
LRLVSQARGTGKLACLEFGCQRPFPPARESRRSVRDSLLGWPISTWKNRSLRARGPREALRGRGPHAAELQDVRATATSSRIDRDLRRIQGDQRHGRGEARPHDRGRRPERHGVR